MALRIRQLALVAEDLDPVVDQLCETLGVEVCHRDPGVGEFGLHNALLAIGDTFLEVVSPQRAGTTAGRLLERRGGDGGYMVLLQTAALAADRKRCAGLGVRVIWQIELEDIAAMQLHPKDMGAAILSFDQPHQPEEWRWAGPSWRQHIKTERVVAIVGAELQSKDPEALATRWADVLGLPSRKLSEQVFAIELGTGANQGKEQLRFVADSNGRGEGLSAVIIQRATGATLQDCTMCGTWFRFVD